MKDIKKLMITLVALLAVTTGAWAGEEPQLLTTINASISFLSGSQTFDDKVTVNFSKFVYYSDEDGWYADESLLTVAGTNGYTITSCKFYTANGEAETGYTIEGKSPSVYLYEGTVYTDANESVEIGTSGVTKIEVYGYKSASSSSGPEVAWTAASKTGTFTMPGGNVTVSVEYYDLATLADKGLTAVEDAAAKTEAPLAVLAENAITGGTVMYYVAPDANFSQADAIALAETAWSADIPTAETIDAEGTYYVWYYIKGDDEHSDTDPQRLAVTVLPEPTYTVEFAEGTEESDKWTVKAGTDGSFQSLPLEGVKAGTKVKLKYDGDRSMLKGVTAVKAVKKAAAVDPAKAYLTWDADQKKQVATEIPTTAIKVENADADVNWSAGTYVVDGQVNINGAITLSGEVDLIINDGAKLTAKQIGGSGNNLRIYGQANQSGQLVVNHTNGDAIMNIKTLEVHSAQLTATSSTNNCGGIYGISTFNVYGGLVDAKGTSAGYGISLNANGKMNIHGGEVKAEGKGTGSYSYGIRCGNTATVTVFGGKLWAGNADKQALTSNITITKGEGFSGKIETSDDNVSWNEYDDIAGTLDHKYVRVGY